MNEVEVFITPELEAAILSDILSHDAQCIADITLRHGITIPQLKEIFESPHFIKKLRGRTLGFIEAISHMLMPVLLEEMESARQSDKELFFKAMRQWLQYVHFMERTYNSRKEPESPDISVDAWLRNNAEKRKALSSATE